MRNNIDRPILIATGIILLLTFASFSFWTEVSMIIMNVLNSHLLTVILFILVAVITFFHYQKYNHEKNDKISSKDGLEKPIDYLQFLFTHAGILISVQALTRETFAHFNFPELSQCEKFSSFDSFGFIAAIVVLTIYSYAKIQPVIQDTYINKVHVKNSANAKNTP